MRGGSPRQGIEWVRFAQKRQSARSAAADRAKNPSVDILPSMNEGDSLVAINALIAEH
jgi:hypothetical protein